MKKYFFITIVASVCISIWYYTSFNNKENMALPVLKLDKLEMRVDSIENRIENIENLIQEKKCWI